MRFQYSFQKIVDLKTNEKSQAEWVLSTAVGRLQEEENSLSTLQLERTNLQNDLLQTSSATTVSELLLFQSYMGHIDREISRKNEDVLKAKQRVEAQKEVLTEKMIQEKVWMKARERALNEFRTVMGKKEQEQLDEMATTRYKLQS